ncbi:MAG: glycoside hydrolase family 99-like domain-containing protein [Rhodospirillaceae bacterium]|nr:glycoside hydrolase family 99-like domain-containing protein [Rhodospirillaceae bacterium]
MPSKAVPSSIAGQILHPSKLKQLRPVGAASDRVYESLSDDPHCRLEAARRGALASLPRGAYQVAAIILGIHGSVLGPELHVDWGAGMGGPGTRIGMTETGAGIFIATLTIDRPVAGLRLDPTTRNGKFVLGPVWLQPATRSGAGKRWPGWVGGLLRAIDRLLPPSIARCRWKASLLVRHAVRGADAADIAAGILADADRQAILSGLRRAFLKLASAEDRARLEAEQARLAQGGRGAGWQDPTDAPIDSAACSVKTVAFYLPQFHPIPENDLWWGEGFTEWRNVKRAVPQFVGHRQPRRPADLGYYDLRDTEVMRRQIEMAKAHGLHGFCFHHYWFHGKRLLERPVDQLLADPTLDTPFCLCWANENWTRRWDGADHEILIAQDHSPEDDLAFFRDLSRYLKDPRYIRINGKPLVIVYRPGILPEAAATAARWRAEAARIGLPGLFLAATNAFGFTDHRSIGFDALIEFPPYTRPVPLINERLTFYNADYAGVVHDYADIMQAAAVEPAAGSFIIPGAMPGWDNEARRPGRGKVIHGATPELFGRWLDACFTRARDTAPPGQRFVFINAWNEWAEAAYLEPDQDSGFAYLNALARCVRRYAEIEGKDR